MSIKTHRHDFMSMFQSVAEEVAQRMDAEKGAQSEERGTAGGGRPNRNHPVVDLASRIASHREGGEEPPEQAPSDLVAKHGSEAHTLWDCAKLSSELLEARLKGDDARAQQLDDELKFSTCDPKWAEAVTDYLGYFGVKGGKKEIPYVRYQRIDDFVLETLPRNARVAVVGDWGTGTEDAVRVLEQLAAHAPDVVIHLGDIYYSGTPKECQSYFLDVLDRVLDRAKTKIPVYTLTGNHDMYSGGLGYYGLLPKLNPEPTFTSEQAQPASYFALRSPGGRWQLLGMDTGLHDHDPFTVSKNVTYLDPQEEAWHVDKVRSWSARGGRTLLFSHHQLFSRFESVGKRSDSTLRLNPELHASFEKLRGAGDVAAWLWGHEHNLCIYEPWAGLEKGRCMGHGAIPVFADSGPYTDPEGAGDLPELVDDPAEPGRKLMLALTAQVYAHGFAILELDDESGRATARYYQETSEAPMYEEEL